MKSKVLLAVTFIAVMFLFSVSMVSALGQNEASVSVIWVNQPVHPGDTTSVIITFTSSTSDQLLVSKIGLHFDWMDEGQYYTKDLTDSPVTITGNSAHAFDAITIQIPPYVTAGSHSFTVAVLGVQGSSTDLSWGSAAITVNIVAGGTTVPTATPTSSAGDGGQQAGGIPINTLAIIVAVVVVVVVALVVVLMMKRRKPSKPAAASTASQPAAPASEEKPTAPEQKPAEEKPSVAEDKPAASEEKPASSDYTI